MQRRDFLTAIAGMGLTARHLTGATPSWRAGIATVDITPDRSLWMAGYAARTQASQGVALPLHAKALALQAGDQPSAVLVTADLLGVTAKMTDRVASLVQQRHRVRRADLLFNASHTHCGPVVDEQLSVAYGLTPQQLADIRTYTTQVEDKLVAVIGEALSRLAPVRLSYTRDQADFAANRRTAFTPLGPVDHTVHVLRIDDGDGKLKAVVFGYACHNTTLPATVVQYHGDYAGVAQATLEQRHAGAVAMFVAGCGADANPMPRGTMELVNAHGTTLADSVDRALTSSVAFVPASLRTAYGPVDLPFADDATRARWHNQLKIDPIYLERHAAVMKQLIDRDGRLPRAQRDPVQVWHFGSSAQTKSTNTGGGPSGFTLVALGGEVVVDYAIRLAREYPGRQMWVAGYSNDVFGYVPSLRVLREGGYEGGDAMIYYARPGPFNDRVEELIIAKAHQLIGGRHERS